MPQTNFESLDNIFDMDLSEPLKFTMDEEPSSVLADTDTKSIKSLMSESKSVSDNSSKPMNSEIQCTIKFINQEMHEKATQEIPNFLESDQTRFDVIYKTALRMMRRYFAEQFRSFLKPFEKELKIKAYNHKGLYQEKILSLIHI